MFLLDSVSRAEFMRSLQPLVKKLRDIEREGTAEIYELFRHSSVGWGT